MCLHQKSKVRAPGTFPLHAAHPEEDTASMAKSRSSFARWVTFSPSFSRWRGCHWKAFKRRIAISGTLEGDWEVFLGRVNSVNYKYWLAWASDNLLFIFLILILVLDSSSWCTYGGFRTWGGEQGGLKSPRSRPKVLSPDNLAIFVAQLVGKTSFIPPHQPPHHPPYGTRETGPRANTSERNDEQ